MPFGEFNLIRKFFTKTYQRSDVSLGVGGDAAVVNVPQGKQLVVTTDTLVAGVHFPEATSPRDIAYKSIVVNLSDLAAMGAEPAWLTLCINLPEVDHDWLQAFSESFYQTCEQFQAQLIGGDTVQGPLSVTVQAMGLVDSGKVLQRGGAQPGDLIYVSGTLGDAAIGLDMVLGKRAENDDRDWFISRLNRPEPRIELGLAASAYCSAAIDISDGLDADLGHVLEASGCGATVNVDSVPLSDAAKRCFEHQGEIDWTKVLASGDDYELCLTVAPENETQLVEAATSVSVPVSKVGEITASTEVRLLDDEGKEIKLKDTGYDHFS